MEFELAQPPYPHVFEYLASTWKNILKRIRKYGLVEEDMSLGAGFEVSNNLYYSELPSLTHDCGC